MTVESGGNYELPARLEKVFVYLGDIYVLRAETKARANFLAESINELEHLSKGRIWESTAHYRLLETPSLPDGACITSMPIKHLGRGRKGVLFTFSTLSDPEILAEMQLTVKKSLLTGKVKHIDYHWTLDGDPDTFSEEDLFSMIYIISNEDFWKKYFVEDN